MEFDLRRGRRERMQVLEGGGEREGSWQVEVGRNKRHEGIRSGHVAQECAEETEGHAFVDEGNVADVEDVFKLARRDPSRKRLGKFW